MIWLKLISVKNALSVTTGFLIMSFDFTVLMIWRYCGLLLAILLLSLLKLFIVVVLFTTLQIKSNSFAKIFCAWWSWVYIKCMLMKSILSNYYSDSVIKTKKLKTENISIDEKNYKDLMIYFTRYVCRKSIKNVYFIMN